jgi:hypothetical protein
MNIHVRKVSFVPSQIIISVAFFNSAQNSNEIMLQMLKIKGVKRERRSERRETKILIYYDNVSEAYLHSQFYSCYSSSLLKLLSKKLML